MAARFESVDDRGSMHADTMRVGVVEGHAFRMRSAVAVMVSGCENLAVADHHRADQRIRIHPTGSLMGQFQRLRHVFPILRHVIHGSKHIASIAVPHFKIATRHSVNG